MSGKASKDNGDKKDQTSHHTQGKESHSGHGVGTLAGEAVVHVVAEKVAGPVGGFVAALVMPSSMGNPEAHAPGYSRDLSAAPPTREATSAAPRTQNTTTPIRASSERPAAAEIHPSTDFKF